MFGNKIGMTEIELFYDDESSKSETELDVSEKMGALKFHNLICKIKTDLTKKCRQHPITSIVFLIKKPSL